LFVARQWFRHRLFLMHRVELKVIYN